jgi:hypothetical protein
VSLNVLGVTAGVENNSVQATSTNGGPGNTATASITVVAPPVISKAFGLPKIVLYNSTTLTFSISNPNATVSLTGVGFTDTVPAGLVISTPNGLTGTCGGGVITATAGTGTVSLSGATLAPSASCTFTVSVTAVAAGTQVNTTSAVTSTNGGNGNTASATVIVIYPYYVSYFSNNIAAAPDATVRVINDGVTGTALYAEFFVFDDSEELTQCCGCQVTPDGLLSESVQQQLTAFALQGAAPTRGVIKMFASKTCFGGNCLADYGQPNFTTLPSPTHGLHAWATYIQSGDNQNPNGPAPYSFTETPFANANLDFGELGLLESLCSVDSQLGGQPCSCTPEDDDF